MQLSPTNNDFLRIGTFITPVFEASTREWHVALLAMMDVWQSGREVVYCLLADEPEIYIHEKHEAHKNKRTIILPAASEGACVKFEWWAKHTMAWIWLKFRPLPYVRSVTLSSPMFSVSFFCWRHDVKEKIKKQYMNKYNVTIQQAHILRKWRTETVETTNSTSNILSGTNIFSGTARTNCLWLYWASMHLLYLNRII